MPNGELEQFFVPGGMFSEEIKPDDPDLDWVDFETNLRLQKTPDGWIANTEDGRRIVEITETNFSTVISYALGSETHRKVTRVPHLDRREMTRGGSFSKRLWEHRNPCTFLV